MLRRLEIRTVTGYRDGQILVKTGQGCHDIIISVGSLFTSSVGETGSNSNYTAIRRRVIRRIA